jgi:Trp operon repressor
MSKGQKPEFLSTRREKVQELCSKGHSQREIASILQIGLATVNRDLSYLRNEARDNIKRYVVSSQIIIIRNLPCSMDLLYLEKF